MSKIKILNAWHLKLFMAALMVLDHLHYIQGLIPSDTVHIFNIVTRCVAPMFGYLAVEGIRHTRNIRLYCIRLIVLASITFAGNAILNFVLQSSINNNVIFTLAFGVLVIALVIWGREKKNVWLYILAGICFIVGFLWGEWGTVLLPFMVVTYLFHEKKLYLFIGYAVIVAIAFLIPWSEPWWFIVFPFILLYNGERGLNTRFAKYFFYVFYPLHLWIITIISAIVI